MKFKPTSKSQSTDILLMHPCYNRRLGSGVVPPIGLAYLGSFLRKKGFISKIIDYALHFHTLDSSSIKKMVKKVREDVTFYKPKLAIGIGPCTTSSIRAIIAIANTCKKICPNIPLIFGGPLTLVPKQEWLFFKVLGASAVVKGDGEYPLEKILSRLREDDLLLDIPGVQCKKDQLVDPYFVDDLSKLPYPAWDMFELESYRPSVRRDIFIHPFAPIMGSRGCPYKCNFCLSGQLIKYRRRSFENIAKEVQILHRSHGIRSIIFYDDALFTTSKTNEELRIFAELLDQYAPGIKWQIEIRPDVFCQISTKTIEHIFNHGCRQLNIGVEKSSPDQLRLLNKIFDVEQFREACLSVTKACPEMRLTGTFILGGPEETFESILENIEFSTQLNLLFAHYTPLELYPGTPLYYSVFGEDEKIWFDKIMNDYLSWGEVLFENDQISTGRLMDSVSLAYRRFYQRNEWKEIAKRHLGSEYQRIQQIVKSWQRDRFSCYSL